MILTPRIRKQILLACFFFGLAVALGAFGAHGLESVLTAKALDTYHTGISYQFYHSIALFITIFLHANFEIDTKVPFLSFLLGMVFFCFNCYFYAITQIKLFALIVPLGGVLFLIGWISLFVKTYKSRTS